MTGTGGTFRASYGGTSSVGGAVDVGLGPWGTGTPGPTSGRPIVLPAGVLRATVTTTGFSANGVTTAIWVQVYFDGVYVGDCLADVVVPTNLRVALPPSVFSLTITTAGTHYWALKMVSGSSAATDRASFNGIVLPT